MDEIRLDQEREQALKHRLRRAILDKLNGEERTAPELASILAPEFGPVVTDASPLALVNYHLRVLHRARLVSCVGGLHWALTDY